MTGRIGRRGGRFTPTKIAEDSAEGVVDFMKAAQEIAPPAGKLDDRRGDDSDGGEGFIDTSKWPVTPLGVRGNLSIYLDAAGQLQEYKPNEHGGLGIEALWGKQNHRLIEQFPRVGNEGAVTGVEYRLAARQHISACARRGIFDPIGRVRGRGAWLGEEGELVLHFGDAVLFAGKHWHEPGVIGRYVYPADQTIAKPWPKRVAGGARGPAQHLLSMLETWQWKRGRLAAVLLLGWIGAAIVGGALKWRPLVWIPGPRGVGKSTLHRMLELFFDGALIASTDASAAGLWQTVGHSSLPILIDELESDDEGNKRSHAIVKLARQAASGGMVLRGGTEHTATQFTARSPFLFSSILMPPLPPQDLSRIAILELGKLGDEAPPVLDAPKLKMLGQQLQKRMIDGWDRWPETLAVFRAALAKVGHDARGCDLYGGLLAAADILLHDDLPHGDFVQELAEQLRPSDLAEADDDAGDEERAIQFLISQSIPLDSTITRRSVAEWIQRATGALPLVGDDGTGATQITRDDAARVLARYGLRIIAERGERFFAVANNHAELAKLFAGTHWAAKSGPGVWRQSLRRLLGARPTGKTVWFLGVSSKATAVPLDLVLTPQPAEEEKLRPVRAPRFALHDEPADD